MITASAVPSPMHPSRGPTCGTCHPTVRTLPFPRGEASCFHRVPTSAPQATTSSISTPGAPGHDNTDTRTGTPAADGRVLASRQLPLGRADLPLRQSAPEATAGTGARKAARGRALGHDAGPELHLCAPEPGDQEVRPRHVLHRRARPRRPGAGRQHLPGGHVQRDLSRRQPGRGRAETAVWPVLLSRRDLQPRGPDDAGVDPRGGRARVLAQPCLRGRVRQPRSHRRLRHRRRRGGDRPAGDRVAVQQVPEPDHRRSRAADPAPERLQDQQPDRARPHRARGAGPVPPRLRLDAPLRGG